MEKRGSRGSAWHFLTVKQTKAKNDEQQLIDELYKQVGQLKVENDWLKKKVDSISS